MASTFLRAVALGSALVLAGCGSSASGGVAGQADAATSTAPPDCGAVACRFVVAWEAAMETGTPTPGFGAPGNAGFADRTLRQVVRVGVPGAAVRVRVSNLFGAGPLVVGGGTVAPHLGGGAIEPSSARALTFGGAAQATLAPGEERDADDVPMPVSAGEDLAISLYFPGTTGPATFHEDALATTWLGAKGDQARDATMAGATTKTLWFFLSGVDALADARTKVVVTLGDSLTDGFHSAIDANDRWPDVLRARLAARGGTPWSVANAGISGNGLLSELMGPSAPSRLARDVLDRAGATHVVLLEGINDLGFGYGLKKGAVAPARLIAGYRAIVDAAHARGLVVVGGTLLPFRGSLYFDAGGEAARQAANAWIRTGAAFDGVIDFEAAVTDGVVPPGLAAPFDSGDHLHPGPMGYAAMADAVPLELFP